MGNLLTGIFHQKWVAALDGNVTSGGAIDGSGISFAYQLAGSLSISAYSFVLTFGILAFAIHVCKVKFVDDVEDERVGIDLKEMGEVIYGFGEEIKTMESVDVF